MGWRARLVVSYITFDCMPCYAVDHAGQTLHIIDSEYFEAFARPTYFFLVVFGWYAVVSCRRCDESTIFMLS